MAKVKRVEAKIILQKNDEGYWLLVDSPSGKHAVVIIENVFKGTVRETILEWAEEGWVCEVHPDKPFNHEGCGGAGGICTNPNCDKDPDSVFAYIHCRVVGRRKPPVRNTLLNA